MRKIETKQRRKSSPDVLGTALGVLLSLGVQLLLALLGAILISGGILRTDAMPQFTAATCLIGCFVGGSFTCARWGGRRLPAGILTGILCFGLILLIALLSDGRVSLGTQALIELAGCVVGGGLAGMLAGRRSGRRRK